jgi:hypothetical protein
VCCYGYHEDSNGLYQDLFARADLLRSGVFEGEDLGLVAAAVHALLAGTVTSLAALPSHALSGIQL